MRNELKLCGIVAVVGMDAAKMPPERMPPERMPLEQTPPERTPPERMPPERMPPFESKIVGAWELIKYNGTLQFAPTMYTFFKDNTFFVQNRDEKYIIKGTWKADGPDTFTMAHTHAIGDGDPVLTLDELVEWETPIAQEGNIQWVSDTAFRWSFRTIEDAPLATGRELEFVRVAGF